jgi:hypothetical protein
MLYLGCISFKLVAYLFRIASAHLVEYFPKTFAMVHLYGVAQFVQQDIIYQFVAEQYKVYAQTDVAFAAAASPTAVAVTY